MNRKIRYGMVGGGRGAFIGAVHRMAAALDQQYELVAGCFASTPEKSHASGADLGLPAHRVYGTYQELIAGEAALPADQRMDTVVIVTPNHMHFPPAKAALEAGFHVICDKPVTFNLDEAKALRQIVERTGLVFALTHNYTGYPMVKQARELVRRGELGEIRKIVSEYPQGWLASNLEATGQKQAGWRTDPARAGAGGSLGDIGTHAENLARYISGLHIQELCADLTHFVPGRALDDDANLLVHYTNGARGIIYSSQISVGEENALTIRIYGTKASLHWQQEHPNELIVKYPDAPAQIYRRGNGYNYDAAKKFSRIPAGHPEAFLEAFANIYVEAARAIGDAIDGDYPDPHGYDFPTIHDGVYGMAFIQTVIASTQTPQKWTPFIEA